MYVFLTGPPGVGKSVVAPKLARKLGARMVDLDRAIERQARKPVTRVFAEDGEARFRQLEREALRALPDAAAWTVVATGGGAAVDAVNRAAMRERGLIVGLGGRLSTLRRRIADGARPLLAGEAGSRLAEIVERRRFAYADADLRIPTDERTPDEVASLVAEAIVQERGTWTFVGGAERYPVRLRLGALEELGWIATTVGITGRVALLVDRGLGRRHLTAAVAALRESGSSPVVITVAPGEAAKSFRSLEGVWRALARARVGRDDAVLGLGGGSVTDLAGFAAATYARGIRWVAVPTTLLGMVDAAIGGKTAIDLPEGKNLAGAFHDPAAVVMDIRLLESLLPRERRSGLAEVVKTGVVAERALFDQVDRSADALRDGDTQALFTAVAACVRVKGGIVSADPRETGIRLSLNFGHTFGHALEAATRYRRYAHGEAVALGMVFASALAEKLDLSGPDLRLQLEGLLERIGLPTRCRVPSAVWEIVERDKKRHGGRTRWILPRRIGRVSVVEDVPPRALRSAARILER
jgi:shikimate kinase/3-dehydroquinate synthase